MIISSFVALSLVHVDFKIEIKAGRFSSICESWPWLAAVYKRTIHGVLEHVWLTFFACLLVAAGSGALYFNLDNELLPTEDPVKSVFLPGSWWCWLELYGRQAVQMEDILLPYVESGDIESIYTGWAVGSKYCIYYCAAKTLGRTSF